MFFLLYAKQQREANLPLSLCLINKHGCQSTWLRRRRRRSSRVCAYDIRYTYTYIQMYSKSARQALHRRSPRSFAVRASQWEVVIRAPLPTDPNRSVRVSTLVSIIIKVVAACWMFWCSGAWMQSVVVAVRQKSNQKQNKNKLENY